MMKFNETLIYSVLAFPIKVYQQNCIYYFLLSLPFVVVMMSVGLVVGIIFDFGAAIVMAGKSLK